MSGLIEALTGLIWVAVIAVLVMKKKSRTNSGAARRPSQPPLPPARTKASDRADARAIQRLEAKTPSLSGSYSEDAPRFTRSNPGHSNAKNLSKGMADKRMAGSLRDNSVLLENRSNDWLAKQMREEQRALMRSEILDLGARHDADCDAHRLKVAHILAHDDSIDNAEY